MESAFSSLKNFELSMRITITGGTGFLGRHLTKRLSSLGHEVVLIRRPDLSEGSDRISKLIKSAHVVINLAGSPVITRWSEKNKREILASRLDTTDMLVKAVLGLPAAERPSLFISASAIGIYDSINIHKEDSGFFDDNFLADVVRQWENCLKPLDDTDVRVCVVRIGMAMGEDGGIMQKLTPLFKAGLGGQIGSGRQGFSFIHYTDICRAVSFLTENSKCKGIFNFTAPQYTTNALFTRTLAKECHRPAFFRVPGAALRLVYGEAAVALLSGQFVYPQHLLDCGYEFSYPDIVSAVKAVLEKK